MTAKMTREERQARIVELIIERGSFRVEDLSEYFGVSQMTLYRDLAALESRQMISRHRGTVCLLVSSISEAPFSFRLRQEREAKESVARAAAKLVATCSTIFIDDSSSAYYALEHIDIPEAKAFITNALPAARAIGVGDHQSLTLLGGRHIRQLDAFFGPATTRQVNELAFETAIFGAAALRGKSIYHPFSDAALFKQEVIARTDMPILAITASKLNRVALNRIADLSDFSYLIIDDSISDQELNDLSEFTNVIVANKEGTDNVRAH